MRALRKIGVSPRRLAWKAKQINRTDRCGLGAEMIGLESDQAILQKLRERLRSMTDEELIKFGIQVRKLAENPFQRQLNEARAEWKRRRKHSCSTISNWEETKNE
jgi:hypothetical protein